MRLVAVVAVVLAVAGCTGSGESPPSSPPPPSPPAGVELDGLEQRVPEVDEPPGEPGFAVGPARWTSAGGPLSEVQAAAVAGDSVLLTGLSASPQRSGAPGGLAVVDAATGAVRWSLREEDHLPGGRGEFRHIDGGVSAAVVGDLVVVPFSGSCAKDCAYHDGYFDKGVAALSLADGRVRWQTVVLDVDEPMSLNLVGASDSVVVVGTFKDSGSQPRAVGLDPRTGAVRWEETGYLPAELLGQVVRVHVPVGTVLFASWGVADAETGRLRWDTTSSPPDSSSTVAFGEHLAVVSKTNSEKEVVSVGDGSVRAGLPWSARDCAVDREQVVCTVPYEDYRTRRLFSLRVTDDGPRISRREISTTKHVITPSGALVGWTEEGPAHRRTHGPVHVYDRSANRLGDTLPGRPLTVTAGVAVFATPAGAALHPLR